MRNLKKVLALVLALVMSFSMLATANAALVDQADVDAAYAESVDVLTALNVIKGYEDGSFKPENNITRAEVAAVLYRIVTGDVKDARVSLYVDGANFSDVKSTAWYAGYVGYCASAGLLKGYPDGTFMPTANVTGYEALIMILRAIGYGKNDEYVGANYRINAVIDAENLGVLANVKSALGEKATREVVCEVMYRTMSKNTVVFSNDTKSYKDAGVTLLSKHGTVNYVSGVVTIAADNKVTVAGYEVAASYATEAGRTATTLILSGKAVGALNFAETEVAYDAKLVDNATQYIGTISDNSVVRAFIKNDSKDGKIDLVKVLDKAVVTIASDSTSKVVDKKTVVTVNGVDYAAEAVVGGESLKKGDVVLTYDLAGVTYFEAAASVSGKIDAIKNGQYRINGVYYTSVMGDLAIGNEGTFFLNVAGKIAAFKAVEAQTVVSTSKVAYVYNVGTATVAGNNGTVNEDGVTVGKTGATQTTVAYVVDENGAKASYPVAKDVTVYAGDVITFELNEKGEIKSAITNGAPLRNQTINKTTTSIFGNYLLSTTKFVFVSEAKDQAGKLTGYTVVAKSGYANVNVKDTDIEYMTDKGVVTVVFVKGAEAVEAVAPVVSDVKYAIVSDAAAVKTMVKINNVDTMIYTYNTTAGELSFKAEQALTKNAVIAYTLTDGYATIKTVDNGIKAVEVYAPAQTANEYFFIDGVAYAVGSVKLYTITDGAVSSGINFAIDTTKFVVEGYTALVNAKNVVTDLYAVVTPVSAN